MGKLEETDGKSLDGVDVVDEGAQCIAAKRLETSIMRRLREGSCLALPRRHDRLPASGKVRIEARTLLIYGINLFGCHRKQLPGKWRIPVSR